MPRKTKAQIAAERELVADETRNRIIAYLTKGGTYTSSDSEIINLYVDTFMFYRQMQEELVGKRLLTRHTNKAGATNLAKNPLAIELTKTVQVLNNLLRSLGLTPAQRKEIITKDGESGQAKGGEPDEDEKDDFDSF